MKIVRVEEVQTTRLRGMRCDRCGCVAHIDVDLAGRFDLQEFLSVDFVAGYGAKAFDDGTRYSCELCEACVKELLGSYLRAEEPTRQVPEIEVHRGANPSLYNLIDS